MIGLDTEPGTGSWSRSRGHLQARVRETEVLARLGGDEFAVLMRDGGESDAQVLASDLSDLVRRRATVVEGGKPGE